MTTRIITGDCRSALAAMPAESVHMVVTSPPYWGLRDYGITPLIWGGDPSCGHEWGDTIAVNATNHTTKARWNHTRNGRNELQPPEKRVSWLRTEVTQGQFCQRCSAWCGSLGLEPTPDLYVDHAVEVFREVRRVLRPDGTLWLNIGDSYCNSDKWGGGGANTRKHTREPDGTPASWKAVRRRWGNLPGIKPKDVVGIPWMLAFALRADGWWLRQDIVWSKPNPMPESVEDRCTKAHEYLFLLSKNDRYHYDADAIREAAVGTELGDLDGGPQRLPDGSNANLGRNYRQPNSPQSIASPHGQGFTRRAKGNAKTFRGGVYTGGAAYNNSVPMERNSHGNAPNETFSRNRRSVWTIATTPFPEAHFATFPPDLVEPCILAGCPDGGTVLDPFGGAGTVGLVADRLRRHAILIELNSEYAEMARRRIERDAGMFAEVAAE